MYPKRKHPIYKRDRGETPLMTIALIVAIVAGILLIVYLAR